MRLSPSLIFAAAGIFCSCTVVKIAGNNHQISHIKFLSEYDIPFNKNFQNTVLGGLSGIDYDSGKNVYYLLSDDRSERNAARYYTAAIAISDGKIDSVIFKETTTLKNRAGKEYPGSAVDPRLTPDPESIRYNPVNKSLIWTSEGERTSGQKGTILEDPAITEIDHLGNYRDTFPLPGQMHMSSREVGPRRNSVFEGLTFADHYKNIFVSLEEPLYNDGLRAGLNDSTGVIRILKYNTAEKKLLAQYAYEIEAVAHAPSSPGAFIINGVSEILSVGENKLLVVERSYSTGRLACTIKVFVADLAGADNISAWNSLKEHKDVRLMSKKLLLNMDDLGIYIDNIEGVCFGPVLANGHQSLIFISDNNFVPLQKTQLLLFEVW